MRYVSKKDKMTSEFSDYLRVMDQSDLANPYLKLKNTLRCLNDFSLPHEN